MPAKTNPPRIKQYAAPIIETTGQDTILEMSSGPAIQNLAIPKETMNTTTNMIIIIIPVWTLIESSRKEMIAMMTAVKADVIKRAITLVIGKSLTGFKRVKIPKIIREVHVRVLEIVWFT